MDSMWFQDIRSTYKIKSIHLKYVEIVKNIFSSIKKNEMFSNTFNKISTKHVF